MLVAVLQGAAMLVVPALIMKFRNKGLVKGIGSIGMSYLAGILVALIFFGINKAGANVTLNASVGEIGSHAAIGIAIPLLLFGANLKEAKKLSAKVVVAFSLLILAVFAVAVAAFFIYGRNLSYGAELSAMATGLYTGGTPNLNAIGAIFGVDKTVIGLANLSDMIIGGVFYLFLLTLCKPLLKKFLKAAPAASYMKGDTDFDNYEDLSYKTLPDKKSLLRNVLIAFLMAAASAGIGVLIWFLTGAEQGTMNDYLVPALMIGVTVSGLIASFNKKIREVKGNTLIGQYLINVFSFGLAMSLNLNEIGSNFPEMLLLYGSITVCSFILHVCVCKLAKIDVDCCMVTMTAGLYGPAFVPAITSQIKNDNLTAPGLICGAIGYAVGTFLGLGTGLLLRLA